MKPITIPDDLLQRLRKVAYLKLIFTDVVGQMKEMNLTQNEIVEVLQYGQGFDGSSVEGFVRLEESDLMAHPRLKSFRILPPNVTGNGKQVGIFFCDIRTPEGKPFAGDPRQCLKRVLRRAKRSGFTFNVGPELEFFIFPNSSTPVPIDRQGYFDAPLEGDGPKIVAEIIETLQAIGIHAECSHHEVAPGQFEIDVKYQDALTAADQTVLIRWIVKRITENHGKYATFLPKPIFGQNGSGMHVHMSLFRGGRNAFHSRRHWSNLSKVGQQFTAGILRYVNEFTLVTNQTVNSYKRIVPGYEAPCYVSVGRRNRSSLVRIPRYRVGKEQATRIELRSPDPACNPYLSFTVMLAAGLSGIAEGLAMPRPIEENIFAMTARRRRELHITMLPGSLQEAIQAAQASVFLKSTLGHHIVTALLNNKTKEWEDYRTDVSKWEIDHLLPRY